MNILPPLKAKVSGFMLVRDKDGKPKIDDPENIPREIFDMLTEKEQEDFTNETFINKQGTK